MAFLYFNSNCFPFNIQTIFIVVLILFIISKLSRFYFQVYNLPPGPLPLPIIGNILLFRSKDHWNEVFVRLSQRYGPVFTIWLGKSPFVFITDPYIAREAFQKNEFSGRHQLYITSLFSNDNYQDVVFTDYNQRWEALRKVTHSAALRFASNDKLIHYCTECVDTIVKLMIEEKGINKAFEPENYIYLLFVNILANSAFGKSYLIEEEEFKKYVDVLKLMSSSRIMLWEYLPLLRLIDWKLVKKQRTLFDWVVADMNSKFKDHYKDYSASIERDFCDALITAKNEALKGGKEWATFLTDENLAMCVMDLFGAGINTSQLTFQWILLFLCYYPEIQKKLRQEIETQIGDRVATHEDKNRCHYVMAFIMEILRLRNVAPNGLPHKAVVDTKLGEYTIPKGSGLFVYHGIILTDEKYWPNGHEFRPERFLENGKYVMNRSKALIPFGVGRRVCIGEKLAIADLFLVLVRFLQITSEYEIVLGHNNCIEADSNAYLFLSASDYEIIFRQK